MQIPLSGTSLPHLANCFPSCRSQLRHISSGSPSPTPRSLGQVPHVNLSGSICPYHCTNIAPFCACLLPRLSVPEGQGPHTQYIRGAQEMFLIEEVLDCCEGSPSHHSFIRYLLSPDGALGLISHWEWDQSSSLPSRSSEFSEGEGQ